ncbi:MAG: hypothetical protein J6R85_03945 [Lentisphaeria bacterium]|nr:hypothetical protein [Lentisphaeria bacterium]
MAERRNHKWDILLVAGLLLAAGVLSAAQNDQVQTLLQQSSAGGLIWFSVVLAGGITWFCCQMRNRLLKIIAAADPEGSLGLQSLASVTGELTLIGGFLIALLLPVFALVMTLAAIGSAYLFQKWMAARQKRHSHPCPACGQNGVETPVLNCALECPVCHTRQPEIRKTGLFGMISTDPIEEEQTHMIRLLTHGRCRFCASRLQGARQCPVCGKEQWTPELRSIYRKNNDFRAFLLFAAGGICFLAPWVGLLIISIFFAPAAANPLTIHLNYSSRLLSKFLFSFCKFLLLIPLLLLATLPGIGLLTLLPYLVRYFFVRKAFLQKVL